MFSAIRITNEWVVNTYIHIMGSTTIYHSVMLKDVHTVSEIHEEMRLYRHTHSTSPSGNQVVSKFYCKTFPEFIHSFIHLFEEWLNG